MNLTGNELASLHAKREEDRWEFTICQLNLNQIINNFILDRINMELKKGLKNRKLTTEDITIDDLTISKGTKVKVRFSVTMKETIPMLENRVYNAYSNSLDIADFYNHIVELFDFYAYALDTDIDNIKIELKELEILDNK